MARGSPTEADRLLSAYLANFGYRAGAPTFEYWRNQGALPPRHAPGKGRGRGRGSTDPPETPLLALGVWRFLDKRNGIADRPDLPRRRRVAEAPLWLWYESYPVPYATMREVVCARFIRLAEWFEEHRRQVAEEETEAGSLEQIAAAADAAVRSMRDSPVFRRQVRAFARTQIRPDDAPPSVLAESATSQLMQALQGHADPEPGVFPIAIESPLILAGASNEPVSTQSAAQALSERLSINQIVKAVWHLDEQDWLELRDVIRAIQETTIALSRSADRTIRKTARATPLFNNATRLVTAIGALATNLDNLRLSAA